MSLMETGETHGTSTMGTSGFEMYLNPASLYV